MRTTTQLLALGFSLALLSPSLAQDKLAPPHEAATQPASDKPMTLVPTSPAPDADTIETLTRWLTGSFSARQDGDQPALVLRIASAKIEGMSGTFMVELARADSAADPFRVYFLQIYVRKAQTMVRLFELPGASGLHNALAGLAAAPNLVPRLDAASFAPSLDLALTEVHPPGRAWFVRGQTEHPFPTARSGAREMTASLTITWSFLELADAGFDDEGKQVWGQPPGKAIRFDRADVQPVIRRDDGLVSITTIPAPPTSPTLAPGGEITIHYTSWLTTGQLLETSRSPGHEPIKTHVPGNVLPGLNKGLAGIAQGERRKIIIPPDLAYGDQGRPPIPPKATLIFDVECLRIDNSSSAPPPPPPALFNPHAPPPDASPTTPNPNAPPIGSPPTNGLPETPRGGH